MKDTQWWKNKYGIGWLAKYKVWKRREAIKNTVKPPKVKLTEDKQIKYSYMKKVSLLTEEVVHLIEGYDKSKRGFFDGFQVDHKISKSFGFINGLSAEDISDITNLQFITKSENELKGAKNLIDKNNRWIIEKNN
jgi:hypothetical protein